MTPEQELERAGRAEFILGDELFKEAVKEVEQALLSGIKRSPIKDAELREKLCQQLIQLEAIVSSLWSYMETGRLAQETVKRRGKKVL